MQSKRDENLQKLAQLEKKYAQTEVFTQIDEYFMQLIEKILTLEFSQADVVFK